MATVLRIAKQKPHPRAVKRLAQVDRKFPRNRSKRHWDLQIKWEKYWKDYEQIEQWKTIEKIGYNWKQVKTCCG